MSTFAFSRRNLFLSAAGVAALAASPRGAFAAAPAIGAEAPDFLLPDTTGKDRRLADFRGKIVVLEWTNHECPYVRKHYGSGNMQAQQREAAAAGVVWLTIAGSAPGDQGYVTAAQADELTKSRNAAPTAVLLDPKGRSGRLYDARVTPHMYIIDKTGALVYAGGIDSIVSTSQADVPKATQYVRQALAEMAAGKQISVSTSRAYGCTIKYHGAA